MKICKCGISEYPAGVLVAPICDSFKGQSIDCTECIHDDRCHVERDELVPAQKPALVEVTAANTEEIHAALAAERRR